MDQSWGNPNLDQKTCSENEKKRCFTHLFLLTASFGQNLESILESGKIERTTINWIFLEEGGILFWKFSLIHYFNKDLHFLFNLFKACIFGPLAAVFVSQFEVLKTLHRSVALEPLQGDAWPEKFEGLSVQIHQ